MSSGCEICGKSVATGGTITHRGLAKKKGGIGLQLVKTNLRKFRPNLQNVKIVVGGVKKRAQVCTACIRSNKIEKAV